MVLLASLVSLHGFVWRLTLLPVALHRRQLVHRRSAELVAAELEVVPGDRLEPALRLAGGRAAGLVLERGNVRLEEHRGNPLLTCMAAARIGACLDALHRDGQQSLGRITSASFASFSSAAGAPAWKVSGCASDWRLVTVRAGASSGPVRDER